MKQVIVNGITNMNYLIDEEGNVENRDGHQMTQFITNSGYMRVKLSVGCKRGMYSVHRLVAETFVDNLDNLPIVNHLNSVRTDNRASNLRWSDNSTNQLQRYRENGHKGTKRRPVIQVCLETGEDIKEWGSAIDADRALGIHNTNIYKVCRGFRNSAGGFNWKYI